MTEGGGQTNIEKDVGKNTPQNSGQSAERSGDAGLSAATLNTAPWGYRVIRRLLRVWFRLFLLKVRVLWASGQPGSLNGILLVRHPASFFDAMVLISVLDTPVHAVLPRGLMQGVFRAWIAETLRMIPLEGSPESMRDVLDECLELAADGECVLMFAQNTASKPGDDVACELAEKLASRNAKDVVVVPVHLFVPVKRAQSAEILIYIDEPLSVKKGTEANGKAEIVRKELAESLRKGLFSLRSSDLEEVLADLEEFLVQDLAEDWAGRRNWKQSVEGFRLSGLVREWVQGLNRINPGRLVALREALAALREAGRIRALHEIELQLNSEKMKSLGWQLAVWAETTVGFPVALLGAVNHALALGALRAAGLLRNEPDRNRSIAWGLRGLVVVASYVLQVALVYHFWGRGTAGYYAPALPVTGLYLCRYAWLVKNRVRLAFLGMRVRGETENVARLRSLLVEEVSQGTAAFTGVSGE